VKIFKDTKNNPSTSHDKTKNFHKKKVRNDDIVDVNMVNKDHPIISLKGTSTLRMQTPNKNQPKIHEQSENEVQNNTQHGPPRTNINPR
jgi:hypothetical protein